MATATERILARRVAAGDYTIAEVPERYQNGVLDAVIQLNAQGAVTDDQLAEILGQAAADGIITIPDENEAAAESEV